MFTQRLISAHEITLNKHDYLNQLRTSSSFIYEKPTKIKLSSLTYILHLTQGDTIFNVTTECRANGMWLTFCLQIKHFLDEQN
jgi:hypothetical protein